MLKSSLRKRPRSKYRCWGSGQLAIRQPIRGRNGGIATQGFPDGTRTEMPSFTH
ncbi:MAG: hypothetical protein LWW91_06430 [Bacteroidales bacterium]|nr:hypothetical protein [Bacteroidales bacterium]